MNMKNLSLIKKIAMSLSIISICNVSTPAFARSSVVGEYAQGEILSLGSSLSKEQENKLRDYFKAPSDVDVIYVTSEMVVKQLGLDESFLTTYKGGWYSSAYIKLTNGTGINVTADNLTLVTDDMLVNALITSGVLNADVIASAPFKVSGESALAGILAGAEQIMGKELSSEHKETAQKEIETTLEVAEEIGQKEASAIMNEIKAELIKDSPTNTTQIENIVINVTNNYGIKLSDKTRASVVSTMSDINDLDINYKEVESTLKDVGDKLFQDLKDVLDKGEDIGIQIKESGVLQKIWNWITNLWQLFVNWFESINIKGNNVGSEAVDIGLGKNEDGDININYLAHIFPLLKYTSNSMKYLFNQLKNTRKERIFHPSFFIFFLLLSLNLLLFNLKAIEKMQIEKETLLNNLIVDIETILNMIANEEITDIDMVFKFRNIDCYYGYREELDRESIKNRIDCVVKQMKFLE